MAGRSRTVSIMTKKILALTAAALLAVACCFGCSAEADETASGGQSAAADASASASADATETAAAADASNLDLDIEHTIEGLSYKVSESWTETDAGTMAAYNGEAAADLPFSVSVAALDPELVLAAESSDMEPNGALLGILGVDSSGLQQTEFDGQSAISFTGETEGAYEAAGYTIRQDDGTMFVLMVQSTNVSDPDVQAIWQAFLETVKLPS